MRKFIGIVSIVALAVWACTQNHKMDDKEFIRNMYENTLYEKYDFLEEHCTESLLAKLADEYDYDGGGYAVWKFRSHAQDGPSDEHAIISIEDEGDGWYRYTANDMGNPFIKRIRISHEDGKYIIEDVADFHKRIAPLPSGIDVDNLQNCTVPASFSVSDFRWMGGNLRMTVFGKDLYDAVDISLIDFYDTLIYESKPMIVRSFREVRGELLVNGGLDEGGCTLAGYEGGTYVAHEWDDHATYSELGTAEVALAEDFVIIDCGEFPNEPADTIRTGQKQYLESLEGYRREFFPLNTLVTIENGMITEINRRWIP